MTDEKETAAAYTEDLSKQALVDHLREIHGITNLNGQMLSSDAKRVKLTKARMVEVHERMHQTLDKDPSQLQIQDGRVYDGTSRYGITLPAVAHVHEAVTVRPDVAEALEGIRSGDNPLAGSRLSAGERSALIRIIDNDYAALKTDLQSLAAQALTTDLAQLELDWADRRARLPIWTQRAQEKATALREALAALHDEAVNDGVELSFPQLDRYLTINATAAGYEKAIRETKESNKKLLDSALLKLERERLRAQRQVLLTGITPEAQKILDSIPSAEKMLGESMARAASTAQLTTGAPSADVQ